MVFINQTLLDTFGKVDMEHLAMTWSSHAPLLISCGGVVQMFVKPFRFFKYKKKTNDFKKVVLHNPEAEVSGDVFVQWNLD